MLTDTAGLECSASEIINTYERLGNVYFDFNSNNVKNY